MPNAEVEGLRKEFGSLVAVEDLDLTIHKNEFITLVGPSGCGKTTTLRMIAGLEEPTSGRVSISGRDVTKLSTQQRNIALLFQDIALYPHMSVAENMAYGLKLAGEPKDERLEKVKEAADWLQIDELLESSPSELSGGQQQRVALGRSMVRDPDMFLFDEPMSDLDAKLKRELRPLFEEVTREIGCPTLYVTHDQEEAMTMSDRVAVLNDGQLEQVAPPEEIYNAPETKFVGEFMGMPSMEFFNAEVREFDGDHITLELMDDTWDIQVSADLSSYVDDALEVGIRPQYFEVTTASPKGIEATHVLDEPLGNETHSIFETARGRLTVVTPAGFEGEQDEYVLVPDTAEMILFDPVSEERVS